MDGGRSKRRISGLPRSSKILSSFYKPGASHGHKASSKGSPPLNPSSAKHAIIPASSGPPQPMTAGFIIVNKDQLVYPQQTPKVAFVVADRNHHDSCAKVESFYSGLVEDEAVDVKAAKYITDVQERFRSAELESIKYC